MLASLAPTCSVSLAGLTLHPAAPWGRDARTALDWACRTGAHAVQLDATMPGLRPRELDASARRDIRALARRHGVFLSGLDCFIPAPHLLDPAHQDRAMYALRAALELARDLADPASSAALPHIATLLPPSLSDAALHELRTAAQHIGVALADCAWPPRTLAPAGPADVRTAIDPAAVFAAGADLLAAISALAAAPAHARLSDLSSAGRAEAGTSRLDILAYHVTLTTKSFAGPLIIDLRGLRDQAAALQRILARVRG